jgi:hypothetical protein
MTQSNIPETQKEAGLDKILSQIELPSDNLSIVLERT